MKKIISLLIVTFFCFFAATTQARNGIYITLETGVAKQVGLPAANARRVNGISTSVDNSFPTALRASIGYNHDLCRLPWLGLGLNVGIARYGKQNYNFAWTDHQAVPSESKVQAQLLEFTGVATIHLKRFDIFGRIGGSRDTMLVTGSHNPVRHTLNRPIAAVGAAYNFNPHFAVMASYLHVFGMDDEVKSLDGLTSPSINAGLLGIRLTC